MWKKFLGWREKSRTADSFGHTDYTDIKNEKPRGAKRARCAGLLEVFWLPASPVLFSSTDFKVSLES